MTDWKADSPFAPLIGALTWHVRRGVGTFLTMEFGAPHLSVREPIEPRHTTSPKGIRRLKQRVVHIVGDWHLWIQHADWRLTTAHAKLTSDDEIGTPLDDALADLDGQKLLSAEVAAERNRWTLTFDLGGSLEIWPANYEAEELWGLYRQDRRIIICRQDGTMTESAPDQEA
jgi:hypothetical protein